MLIAVDGTSLHISDSLYQQEMSGSFVSRIYREHRGPKKYFRGPTFDGLACATISNTVVATALDWVGRYPGDPVFLAGYSRGGAICVDAARKLIQQHVVVSFLALFDAVDRAMGVSASTIPGNVRQCCHAVRNWNNEVNSRPQFGNCALSIAPPGKLQVRRFRATHAALGGLPWEGDHPVATPGNGKTFSSTTTITQAEDVAASEAVRQWMWSEMAKAKMLSV